MESRDRHDPFLPNLAMTPWESVIAKLGNQGLKQSEILKLTFEKSHALSSEIKSGNIFFAAHGMIVYLLASFCGNATYHSF